MLEDLIVALKIVTPNSKTDENKENIENDDANNKMSEGVPMDQSEEGQQSSQSATQNDQKPEVEMVSDVDCSISEND